MGLYLNPGNAGFTSMIKRKYVDKTGLISFVNDTLGTKDKLTCVSRPRRFGKSYTAQMLCAYYDRSCDSRPLFQKFEIAKTEDFELHLNKYDVIYLDITWFLTIAKEKKDIVNNIEREVISEIRKAYPDAEEMSTLPETLAKVNEKTGNTFIIIIDEWDALFREERENTELLSSYLSLLRALFKSSGVTDRMIEAAYITGILPIKKYGTQSAMTDFREYTMLQPKQLAEYVGFTEEEVKEICKNYHMNFAEMKEWYDGYSFSRVKSIYSPNSVMEAVKSEEFSTYWTETETYESLKAYINSNWEGLREDIITMLAGGRCSVSVRKFQNDFVNINSRDDVLTLLVHLGYLAYDFAEQEVYIPNLEVAEEFRNAVEESGWEHISGPLKKSKRLLEDTLSCKAEAVAKALDEIHTENTSVLSYNDENSLSCVITLAYYYAKKDYILHREYASGKGYADIVMVPRKHVKKPALVIELKWDKSVEGAISQIKKRNYPEKMKDYAGEILLVGINYAKSSRDKKHVCVIEKWKKE